MGKNCAVCCNVFSIFGVILLFTFAILVDRGSEIIIGGRAPLENPKESAKNLYIAAFMYLATFVFTSGYLWRHNRSVRTMNRNLRETPELGTVR